MIFVLAWVIALGTALPVLMLALECAVGACRSARLPGTGNENALACIVLMPAHDEAQGIAQVVSAVLAQLRACDELVVIADNCTDDTAAIARALGATVIERTDPALRGKGYALEHGRVFIETQRTTGEAGIVVINDADCLPHPGAIPALVAAAARCGAVVQGAYLMIPPPTADAVVRVSCFAFLVKNLVRQLALDSLAGAALLQGSGMAFPRPVFARIGWAAASLVEDLDMGVELLLAGQSVVFEPAARFDSGASSARGTASQRRRWEHGMLESARQLVPRLLAAGCARLLRGGASLIVVAFDLLVPPTVLLITVLMAVLVLLLLMVGIGPQTLFLLGAGLALALALGAAWWRHGRSVLPVASIGQIPGYILWKLPLLAQFVTRRERSWIRTERGP
ncbi:cellulose synthase/poly-beta-1,6-N-acetylglucosamine synthase-like glycosyltransferase [Novosphingobium sp. PhB165]|uniref:glycosyltransferase family 2 protein n=1 Tax=Novosphingobium sp. PhB165 TaxID=2485105 RepID=UPI00104AB255|nr:glycosyltransferase family 2 protein [Novosphingobium sp. PhB165]TCM20818.1 cellulose synthase/poly-beta-1,6-N-acetylglucosamine synthase-like glycosyltransferase [Novosphingobium sp. PhB165]